MLVFFSCFGRSSETEKLRQPGSRGVFKPRSPFKRVKKLAFTVEQALGILLNLQEQEQEQEKRLDLSSIVKELAKKLLDKDLTTPKQDVFLYDWIALIIIVRCVNRDLSARDILAKLRQHFIKIEKYNDEDITRQVQEKEGSMLKGPDDYASLLADVYKHVVHAPQFYERKY